MGQTRGLKKPWAGEEKNKMPYLDVFEFIPKTA